LTPAHLAELGATVVMVPIDGVWTLNQEEMIEVLQQIKPKIVIPMHIFSRATLEKFLTRIGDLYTVRHAPSSAIRLARSQLPEKPELIVVPSE